MKEHSKAILSMIYVVVFIVWVSCRLVMFPACCIRPAFEEQTPIEVKYENQLT